MKLFKMCCITAALVSAGVVPAFGVTCGQASGQDDPVLHDVMESMNSVFRKLRIQVKDPAQNEISLESIGKLQEYAIVAMGLVPSQTESLAESERSKFLLAYKRQIVVLFSTMLDLEAALLVGDNLVAQETFRKLGTVRRKGHERFQEEEH